MIVGAFLFYFCLFAFIFTVPGWRNDAKPKKWSKLLLLPGLLALGLAFFSVLKIYFVYKILILLFVLVTGLLSYWQWGGQIRAWWNR